MGSKLFYLRFLNIIHTLDEGEGSPRLDPEARKLLEVIAVHHEQGKTLSVTEAMGLNNIASPATIHRRLDQLLEQDMIEAVFEGKNRRTKYLHPTKKAYDYFATIGEAMRQAFAHH